VPELQLLRADHAPAVLAFELANRAYFAAFISDRGDEFFEEFTDRHNALLAEQEAGVGAYYVLVAEDGSVLGRFNLYRVQDGTAELGYRVAQHVAGRGVATGTVGELCGLAAARHGLRTIRAATNSQNEASQRVLIKNGFVATGPADPGDIGGKPGTWYQRDLSAGPDRRDPARALTGRPGGQHLQAAVEHGAVDAGPQAGTGINQCARLAGLAMRSELGAGAHRLQAPLHAGVLRAELGHQRGRPAALAGDRREPGLPLVGQGRVPVGRRAGHVAPSGVRAARFAATSASHAETARVVSTSNS
jgi:[ribosomal protein S5]-alanine N-acetyltransferase